MFVSFEEEENWKQRIYIDIFDILFSNFLTFNLWVEISCSVSKFQIYKKNSLSTLIARTDNSLSHPSSVKPFRPTRGTRGMFVRHWRFARSHETFAPRQKLRTVNEEPRHAPIEPTASSLFLPLCSSPSRWHVLTWWVWTAARVFFLDLVKPRPQFPRRQFSPRSILHRHLRLSNTDFRPKLDWKKNSNKERFKLKRETCRELFERKKIVII